jgi:multiple sugar transport system ATP-binding protein
MATVQLKQVRKNYGATEIIKGVDLTIYDKELMVFVGPSGCGKSTLLRLIAGLEEITSGDLLIDGRRVNDVAPAKRGLALVFQSYALYPHMNVAENMAFSLKLAGVSKAEREKKVLEAAHILHLETYLDRKPKDLSGGQRQRVAIGRAIVRNPKVFLFDEPLSNLDAALRVKMRLELANLHKQLKATMIYVTHDQVEAMTMADKIVVMQAGYIEQVGSPMEVYRSPRNLFVAGFIGSPRMNFLQGLVQKADAIGTTVVLPDGTAFDAPVEAGCARPGDKVTVGIRPEHVTVVLENGIAAQVHIVEHLGSESYLYVQIPHGETLVVRMDGETQMVPDQAVQLKMNERHIHIFDQNGDSLKRLTWRSTEAGGRERVVTT